MKIKTKYLGELEIDEGQIIDFPKGVLGFKNSREFVLIGLEDAEFFSFLQDINNEKVSFLVINPWNFFSDYDIVLPDEKLEKINIDPRENNLMEIYSIVTLSEEFKESTANLLAPVVINLESKQGKQFVLNNSPYTTKHPIFKEAD